MAEEQNIAAVENGNEAAAGDAQPAETTKALLGLGSLMQNPQILAALQNQLGAMVGQNSGYVKTLPKEVQRRIKALKKLQSEHNDVEAKFYEEVHELECKYAAQYAPIYERQREVVTGGVEPTDSDCEWPSDSEDEEEEDVTDKIKEVKVNGEEKEEEDKMDEEEKDKTLGVPSFWLTIFKNVDMLSELVQEHDEPILEKLTDIRVTYSQADPMGFTLHFHFAENDFFSNAVITKEYLMRATPDEEDPLGFEGPEIVGCKGCKIDWKKGKNVTIKLVKKVQKQKRGPPKAITKSVQNDSFFNFFSPPEEQDNEDDVDEEAEALLGADYELGHFLRERIVPRAVLYFTGEALEEDSDGDDEGEDEGDDEGEYDEDADEDFIPK